MKSVYVCSVGAVDDAAVNAVEECLRETFGIDVRRMPSMDDPTYAFDGTRRQYSSILIMRRILERIPSDALRLLALTECDLFIPMLSFVYGQAQLQGTAAIVSLARLRQEFYSLPPDPALLLRRVSKEAIHELGHTFGLIHCMDKSCPMCLSTNIRQLDIKGASYCRSCIIMLQENMRA